MKPCTRIFDQTCFNLNKDILNSFNALTDNDFKEKTHLFHGRYENLYLQENKIHGLKHIIEVAQKNAAEILKIKQNKLLYGFWLNVMQPGDVTTAHTHDDSDELLSGVYYVKVPPNSGDLIITTGGEKIHIKPREGEFVFFKPDVLHEVSRNESQESRLSIAFNFGRKETD